MTRTCEREEIPTAYNREDGHAQRRGHDRPGREARGRDVRQQFHIFSFHRPARTINPAQGIPATHNAQHNNNTHGTKTNEHPQLPPRGRYSQAQVAGILGIDRRTVRRAVLAGEMKIGGYTNKRGKRPMAYYLGKDVNAYWATR